MFQENICSSKNILSCSNKINIKNKNKIIKNRHVVAYACNPSYSGGRGRRTMV
jgi:hypothetical protein